MDKLIIAMCVFSLFSPAIIIWLLQMKFKFDKGYIRIAFYLSFAAGAYFLRNDYFYHSRGGTPGIKIEPVQMIIFSTCWVVMAIWQYVIICKKRNTKTNQQVDLTVKTPVESGKAQGTAGHL
jgi:hypothetical protein